MPTRRDVLKGLLAGAAASVTTGCLFTSVSPLPSGPVRWPVFRFAHIADLNISADDGPGFARALEGGRTAGDLPELDFITVSGPLASGQDPVESPLLEEVVRPFRCPWYASAPLPGEAREIWSPKPAKAGAPWAASPVDGVRLVALGSPEEDPDAHLDVLTGLLDEHPEALVIVLLDGPPRPPDEMSRLGAKRFGSETLRFILEAGEAVKMVLSGGTPGPFLHTHADLIYVGTPPLPRFPHLVREITVSRHGAIIRNVHAGMAWMRDQEAQALAEGEQARRFNQVNPRAWVDRLRRENDTILSLR